MVLGRTELRRGSDAPDNPLPEVAGTEADMHSAAVAGSFGSWRRKLADKLAGRDTLCVF